MSQASKGEGTRPPSFWIFRNAASVLPGSRTITAPPVTSLWPPKYLVVECMTRSTPRSSGRCRSGVAHVLSQHEIAPPSRAMPASASMSEMRMSGFDGVSIHTRRVFGRMAARTASRSVMSTKVASMPRSANESRRRTPVP